ncbi:MAG TPA: gamma-glutamylcyclotransferase [Burkholderiales bacterium]|nr:gamma-glutamylcyclotransferase [Burkholderiales bacterium]
MTLHEFLALAPRGDLWIFGYGSLMWSPGFRCSEKSAGRVHGYHRSLCVYSHRYRGTPSEPGLVMGLCQGGSCWGMAFRVPKAQAPRVLRNLWLREMRNRVYRPRFVRVRVRDGRNVRALAFVADPTHRQFAGDLTVERTAALVANGCGERGRNVDYLSFTLAHMHELGVRDRHLDEVLLAALDLQGRRTGHPVA